MSEPSLLTALIPMSKEAYAGLLKAAAPSFARAVADLVINNGDDWLIFRYLKTEQAFYLAFVFRWEDRVEDIIQRPYFEALLGAAAVMAPDARGRVLISAGALNFMAEEIDAAFTLTASGVERSDLVDNTEKTAFDRLLNKYLFATKPSERTYQEAMQKPSTLDPVIKKKALALLEDHRCKVALERVPNATPLQPVRLFERYHTNGHFMVFRQAGHGMMPLVGFDPATTVQRPWGACDARHVAVRGHVIETDPAKFRVINMPGCEGDAFYRDDVSVYSPDCRRIEGADPKTFKFVGGMAKAGCTTSSAIGSLFRRTRASRPRSKTIRRARRPTGRPGLR